MPPKAVKPVSHASHESKINEVLTLFLYAAFDEINSNAVQPLPASIDGLIYQTVANLTAAEPDKKRKARMSVSTDMRQMLRATHEAFLLAVTAHPKKTPAELLGEAIPGEVRAVVTIAATAGGLPQSLRETVDNHRWCFEHLMNVSKTEPSTGAAFNDCWLNFLRVLSYDFTAAHFYLKTTSISPEWYQQWLLISGADMETVESQRDCLREKKPKPKKAPAAGETSDTASDAPAAASDAPDTASAAASAADTAAGVAPDAAPAGVPTNSEDIIDLLE